MHFIRSQPRITVWRAVCGDLVQYQKRKFPKMQTQRLASTSAKPKVAIIGAGPAGLTLARLLQVSHIPCTVFEGEPNLQSRDQGGTLDLHPDGGLLALEEAGILSQFMKLARPEGEVLRIYSPEGALLMNEGQEEGDGRPKEMHGRPEIDRLKLRELLLESLEPDTVRWSYRLSGAERIKESGEGGFKLTFKDNDPQVFDTVVGADGAWSRIRPLVTDVQPIYSGIAGFDVRIINAVQNEPELAKRCGYGMCLTFGDNKGIMSQMNGDGTIRTYGFMRVPQEWEKECGIDFSNKKEALEEFINRYYKDWDSGAKGMILKAEMATAIPRTMWTMPVGLRWKSQPGATVIGDAAHLMTPFAGVGVNVAMQDALFLARNMARSAATAIADYENEMFERAEKYAKMTVMYQDLFFNPRGGQALLDHFDKVKAEENQAEAASGQ